MLSCDQCQEVGAFSDRNPWSAEYREPWCTSRCVRHGPAKIPYSAPVTPRDVRRAILRRHDVLLPAAQYRKPGRQAHCKDEMLHSVRMGRPSASLWGPVHASPAPNR